MASSSRAISPPRQFSSFSDIPSFTPPAFNGARSESSYMPHDTAGFGGAGGLQSSLPPPVPNARPGFEYLNMPPPTTSPGGAEAYTAGLAYGKGLPNDGGYGFDRIAGLGTWSELIAGGIVDRPYVEKEAERRKQEIDRAMDNQLAQLENQCQDQCASIKQQAEYHAQMAEKQIENHKRQHLGQVARQAELQAYSILQKAETEKARLGQEAYRALAQQSEREKASVLHDAMRKAEDVWLQSQRSLMEQAQKAKADIDVQAQRRAADIEREAREAVSRIYISPQGPLGASGPMVGPLSAPQFDAPEGSQGPRSFGSPGQAPAVF